MSVSATLSAHADGNKSWEVIDRRSINDLRALPEPDLESVRDTRQTVLDYPTDFMMGKG